MPETDGGEVAARIQADPELQNMPIIFLTALVTRVEAKSGLNIQGHPFLAKPVSIPELINAIEEHQPGGGSVSRFSPEGETTERPLGSTAKSYGRVMAAKRIGSEIYAMKKNKLLTLIGTALVGLVPLAWAGPHSGGGGYSGGPHAAPAFAGGARFSGRSIGGLTPAPQQFHYYSGAGMSGLTQHAFVQQLPNRSMTRYAGSS